MLSIIDILTIQERKNAKIFPWIEMSENAYNGSNFTKKPHNSPATKLNNQLISVISDYRQKRKLGARRTQLELNDRNTYTIKVNKNFLSCFMHLSH